MSLLIGLRVANLLSVTTMSMTGRNYCKNTIHLRSTGTEGADIIGQIRGQSEPTIYEIIA